MMGFMLALLIECFSGFGMVGMWNILFTAADISDLDDDFMSLYI